MLLDVGLSLPKLWRRATASAWARCLASSLVMQSSLSGNDHRASDSRGAILLTLGPGAQCPAGSLLGCCTLSSVERLLQAVPCDAGDRQKGLGGAVSRLLRETQAIAASVACAQKCIQCSLAASVACAQ